MCCGSWGVGALPPVACGALPQSISDQKETNPLLSDLKYSYSDWGGWEGRLNWRDSLL
jgi:hypothetical protein